MTRSDLEILLAVTELIHGEITLEQCLRRVHRAEQIPDFKCQDARNWKQPPARSVCAYGNEMKHSFGPCEQCREEHNAIYQPNGKRRIFNHE